MSRNWTYKQQLLVLSVIVGALGLVYTGTLVFDPERVQARAAVYTWIEPQWLPQVDRVEISRQGETMLLLRRYDNWFVSRQDREYPAKTARVEDFLRVLSLKGAFPVRSTSATAHERLGLSQGASRVILRGGAGPPLLNLLIGGVDASGKEVYLRKDGQNEVRSGEDRFSAYVDGTFHSWYNLRLFPEDDGGISAPDVQRIRISDSSGPPLLLSRNGNGWILGSGVSGPGVNGPRVEGYLRAVLDAEGEDFSPGLDPEHFTADGNLGISLELGDGSLRSIRLGLSEGDRRNAAVSNSPYIYELADWTLERLFRDPAYFESP